jgi:hypothetical protein
MGGRQHEGGGANQSLRSPTSHSNMRDTLGAAIAGLESQDADALRLQWRNQLGGTAPAHLPKWLLLRILAYRMQAALHGDLEKATLKLLRPGKGERAGPLEALAFETRAPSTREGISLKSGALLVREWKGKLERVMVLDSGFAWNGQTYRSLSRIAKAMTGTNWNGHRFFGLRSIGDLGPRSNPARSEVVAGADATSIVPSSSKPKRVNDLPLSRSPNADTVATGAAIRGRPSARHVGQDSVSP